MELGRRVVRNTIAVAAGTNLNAVGRLVTSALVVRLFGTAVFAEYAVVLVWLTLAEWILDFGTSEVFIREVSRDPGKRVHLTRILVAMKGVQVPLAMLGMAAGLWFMGYSEGVLSAGLTASLSLPLLAGVAVCRPVFRSTLTMEREVVADFVSMLAMLTLVPLVFSSGGGLSALIAAYVLSRGTFLAGCLIQARGSVSFSPRGVSRSDVWSGFDSTLTIGVVGFVAVAYTAVEILVLSRIASLQDVAVYSAAQRFVSPLVMALNSIAVSIYPVLAQQLGSARFRDTCQRSLETIVQLGGLAVVGVWSAAGFLMSLLSPDFADGAIALQILALTCIFRAVSMVMAPVLYLVRAQSYALGYLGASLLVKVIVLVEVSSRWGYLGAAVASMAVEVLFLLPLTLYSVRMFTGFQAAYSRIVPTVALLAVVLATCQVIAPRGSFLLGIVAMIGYTTLLIAFGIVRISDIRSLLRPGQT